MTQYTKPSVRNAWAESATAADLQDPGNTYAKAGWLIGVKPPRQFFNWVLNYNFSGIRYLCQQGIATWDPSETYFPGNIVVSPAGSIFRCVSSNNVNINPDSVGSNTTNWDSPTVATGSNASGSDKSARIASTYWVGSYFLPVGTSVGSLSGQVTNGQVPVGAITQWQGSLSIGGGQVTSAVARANTVFNTSGNYSTFNWSGQPGQPSWLWGSNDGVNYFVWNPSNFSVNNSNLLQGFSPSFGASGNSVVVRDSSGNINVGYIHSANPNSENPSVSQFVVSSGDGWHRFADPPTVKAALGALALSDFPASKTVTGYQRLPNGVIFQWGQISVSGTTTVTFPIAFPSNAAAVVLTNISSTNQIFLNGAPLGNTGFSVTNGSATISWLAVGY